MRGIIGKYLLLGFLIVLTNQITKHYLNLDKLLLNSLAEKLTSHQIEVLFTFQKKWEWISYIFTPFFFLIKTTLIANILYVGTIFFGKSNVTFKELWNVTIKSEFVFLLVAVVKLIWLYFFQTNYVLEDVQYFYPFSALNIISYKGLESWLIYPLQNLNLFEFAYIILLSFQIGNLTKTNTDTGLKIVASSYVPALLLWVTVVMFFTLNFS